MPPETRASSPQAPATVIARRRGRKRNRGETEIGVINLAEQAFHLLRTTPLATLWLYYLGSVPFVVGVFFFWADMSRSSYAGRDAAFFSLILAGIYLWMKFWQGIFCQRLWEQLHPSGNRIELGPGRQARHLAAQALVHAFALPVTLVSTAFAGWAIAFFQNASALAFTQDFGRAPFRHLVFASAQQAQRNWLQNYLVLGLVLVLSFFIWANVLGASILVPMALKMFFGVETVFTLNPEGSLLNTTFLFGTALLAFLVIDPLLKAIYTLRCFGGLSRHTGADLLSRLDRIESERKPTRPGKAMLVLALLPVLLPGHHAAAEEDLGHPPPSAEELSQSIEETLRDRAYQWRMPRQSFEGEDPENAERGWLADAMSDLADSFETAMEGAFDKIEEFFRKLFEGRRSSRPNPGFDASGAGAGIGVVAKALFVILIAALIGWIVFLLFRKAGKKNDQSVEEVGIVGPVDLESESIVATQLPEDEWMRLAREQIAKGDHRLAVRALFLASLAHLGERGLLRVARFKSNRDYSRELGLKARSLPDLQSAFQENVGLFERVWYGLHEIGRDAIDRFTSNYEQITRDSSPSTLEPPPDAHRSGGLPS